MAGAAARLAADVDRTPAEVLRAERAGIERRDEVGEVRHAGYASIVDQYLSRNGTTCARS